MDMNGLPYKSAKCATTPYLEKRYKSVPVIVTALPWVPTSVIMEGMFMVQTEPFPTMGNMKEYVQMLFLKYIRPHYTYGTLEVYVIFDNVGARPETPKELEQKRRDMKTADSNLNHECCNFSDTTAIPEKWRNLLSCRQCKQKLTVYVAKTMLKVAPSFLSGDQEFITNVKQSAYSTNNERENLPRAAFYSNADESDNEVWLHCVHAQGTRKLIYSPDTDIYHIGLAIVQSMPNTHVLVQLSKSCTQSAKFIDLSALQHATEVDSDLNGIPTALKCQALQTLYVSTGCDYTSFLVGMGKASFLSTFFQYASFIASGDPPGSIGDVSLDKESLSFFSFIRLVGCAYFKSHTSAF